MSKNNGANSTQDLGMTINELLEICQEAVNEGLGNRHIQISCDDEGNGFHSLFYGFTAAKDDIQYYIDEGLMPWGVDKAKDLVLLG